jgi:hypothetical protein
MAGVDKEFDGTARPLPGASIGKSFYHVLIEEFQRTEFPTEYSSVLHHILSVKRLLTTGARVKV